MDLPNDYKFNLNTWLQPFSAPRKRVIINKIMEESKQSESTIKRIRYMKSGDDSHVRLETKKAICKVLNKSLSELENQINKDGK